MSQLDPGNPAQVAYEIANLMDKLEEWTGQFRDDAKQAALSHAAYKKAYAEAMLEVIAASSSRMTVSEREARVEVMTNDDRVIAELHEAVGKATKEAMNSCRVRLDAARSLGAALRHVVG